jgi:uncharacterized repeat protein (TIGR03843 family)
VNEDKNVLLTELSAGEIELTGQFAAGSNFTFLVTVSSAGQTLEAVYKPLRGEMPLWDFPEETLAGREAAAFELSEALGWGLVPPTVIRENGPYGRGSLQLFISHDPRRNYFSMEAEEKELLRLAAAFDLLANNADRKGSHILLDANDHIWLIDHGLCFHAQPKLRTVIWDFRGEDIPADLLADIEKLPPLLEKGTALRERLRAYLTSGEINALAARARHILRQPVYPQPDPQRRPYPWPLV